MPATAEELGFVPDTAEDLGFIPDAPPSNGFVPDVAPTQGPSDGSVITATKSPLDKLMAGDFGGAAKDSYETIRRQVSGLIGPTEAERIEKSVQWGVDAEGKPKFEYKPLGDRLTREQGLMTPFLKVEPFASNPDDSLAKAAGKAVFNNAAALEGSLLSPLGVALPGVSKAAPGAGRIAAGAFSVDMLSHFNDAVKQAQEAPTTQGKIEGWLSAISSLGFGVLGGKHAAGVDLSLRPETGGVNPLARVAAKVGPLTKAAFDAMPAAPIVEPPVSDSVASSEVAKSDTPTVSPREQELLDERNRIVISGKQSENLDRLGEIDRELQWQQRERISPEPPPEMPTKPPDAPSTGIAGPALTDSAGNVLASGDAGVTHASMMKPAMEKLFENPEADPTDIQHAFLDGAGKVLSREEAYDVAEKNGQLNEAGVAKRERAAKTGKPPALESQDLAPGQGKPIERSLAPEQQAEAPPAPSSAQPAALPDAPVPVNEALEGDAFKADSQRYRADLDAYQKQLATWTAEQPEGKPIVFTRGETTRAVTKSPPDPARDVQGRPWRVTTLDKSGEPIGHTLHETREEAVMTAKGTTGEQVGKQPVPTVEEVIQDGVAEHGSIASAGESFQARIDDPATAPAERAVLEGAQKRLNSIAEAEYRREQALEQGDANRSGKYELVSEVKRLGGLPTLKEKGSAATGELGRIIESKRGAFLSLFRKGAKSLDDIRQSLNEVGFDFETPYDMLSAVEDSLTNDRVYYGEKSLPQGPGKMTIGELPPQRTTGLKKAVVADERIQRGLDDLPKAERESEESRVQRAEDRVDSDPSLGPSIVSRIVDKGEQAVSPDDAAVLLVERTRLGNERQVWQDRAADGEPGTEAPLQAIEDQMHRLDQAQRAAGSSWGRVGHLYQRMMRADYTLEAMQRQARAAKGGALTPEELTEVQKQFDDIFAAQADADIALNAEKLAEEAVDIQRVHEAAAKADAPQVQWPKRVFEAAQKIVDSLEARGNAAAERLRGKLGRVSAGVDPSIVLDVAEIMAGKIAKFGLEKAEASLAMIAEFGDGVRPYLEKAWAKATKIFEKATPTAGVRDVVKRTAKVKAQKTPADALATAKAEAVAGESLSHKTVFDYVRALLKSGVKEADVMKAAFDGLKEHFPAITEREVNRAYVDYGKVRFPSKEELAKTERHLRQAVKIQEDIDRLEKDKLDPLKQGYQRDKADIQIRDLIRKRNDLLKERTGPPSPEKLASLDEAKQTRLKNSIEELDRQIQTEEKVARANAAPDSPIVERLKAEAKAMRDLWQEIDARKNPPPTPEQVQLDALSKVRQRLDDKLSGVAEPVKRGDFTALTDAASDMQAEILAMRELAAQLRRDAKPPTDVSAKAEAAEIKALEAAIERYRDRVARGDFASAPKRQGVDSARVAALKEVLASRKSMYEAAKKAGKPVRTAEERYNSTRIKNVERQIRELEARSKAGDFGPRAKKVMPALSDATKKALFELDQKKKAFLEDQHKWKLERRTAFQKAKDFTADTFHTLRAIMTGGEFSGVLRQGKFSVLSRPITTFKGAFPAMFKAFRSTAGEHAMMQEINSRPNAPLYKTAGLEIVDPSNFKEAQLEGNYRSRWANKIPGIAGSGRAYTVFLNRLRADVFDLMVEKGLKRDGHVDLETAKALATYVNESTGAGGLGVKGKAATTFLNAAMFSPKFFVSRFQMLAGHSLWEGTNTSRRIIAGEYGRILTGAAVFYGLANLAGAKIGTDPRSSDFGKIIIGKTRWDPMGGVLQATVLLSRLISGKSTDSKGKVTPIRATATQKVPYGKPDAAGVMGRFTRSKLGPAPGSFVNLVNGADFRGRPVTLRGELQNLALPMTYGDIYDVMKEQGVPTGTALSILAMFGESVNTYTDEGAKRAHAAQ